ncbi:efflux RND transporter permease subunit [Patescibacteria group bacterium]|nr:MAG: efflux RND transporter permease subunit [Patescibacteria group bacterium]
MPKNQEPEKNKSKTEKVEAELENFYLSRSKPAAAELSVTRDEITSASNTSRKWMKTALVALVVLVAVGLGVAAYYFYHQYKLATRDPKDVAQAETQQLVDAIGRFMDLPLNEEPKVATVTDKEKLKSQVFFARAENGDKVLMYVEAQKAILYRPSTGRVIEVSQLLSGAEGNPTAPAVAQSPASETTPVPTETPTKMAKIAVYNGTNIRGLAGEIEKKLTGLENIDVVSKTNAAGSYTKTLIVDVTGGHDQLVGQIVEKVGGESGSLPDGESKPDADILIIGGQE